MDWSKFRPVDEPSALGTKLIDLICGEFLGNGRGTPDHKLRVSLGKERHALDELVQGSFLRNVENRYYPAFRSLYFVRPEFVSICERALEQVFLAIRRLYEKNQLNRYTLDDITKMTHSLSHDYISVEVIRIASQFLRDFPIYFSNFDSSGDAPVTAVWLSENILDFDNLEQAWNDELNRRVRVASAVATAVPASRPTRHAGVVEDDRIPPNLSFIVDQKLREILERDFSELARLRSVSATKSRLILAGGLIVGLLLDALERPLTAALQAKLAEKDRNGTVLPLSDWSLISLIRIAGELGFISTGTQKMCDFARDFRNLVHPEKERSGDYVVGAHEANGAESALDAVIRDLRKRLPK